MNEEPNKLWKKTGNGLRYFRLWLILVAATFLILLIAMLFASGRAAKFFGLVGAGTVPVCGQPPHRHGHYRRVGGWAAGCAAGAILDGCCSPAAASSGWLLLFYAEEDLRGWLTWTRFQARLGGQRRTLHPGQRGAAAGAGRRELCPDADRVHELRARS